MVGSFEEKDWLRFCKALKMFPKSGLAACIVRGITCEDHTIQRFKIANTFVLEYRSGNT